VHSLLGPRAADKKSCLRFSSKVERSSQDMKDASKRRGRMQMDVGYRMQDAGSKGRYDVREIRRLKHAGVS
jgi:hypothetical protein